MPKSNIVLIGFMGSGKSLTSNKLANELKREAISTDQMIEEREGRSISDIFAQDGEEYFRSLEKKAVQDASERHNVIIDCGGGVVLCEENLRKLRQNGKIFYLSASPEYIYSNVKDLDHRPLLNVNDPLSAIAKTLKKRQPLYEQADVTVDADHKSIDEIAFQILEDIRND